LFKLGSIPPSQEPAVESHWFERTVTERKWYHNLQSWNTGELVKYKIFIHLVEYYVAIKNDVHKGPWLD
jgi:hypothetical protein